MPQMQHAVFQLLETIHVTSLLALCAFCHLLAVFPTILT